MHYLQHWLQHYSKECHYSERYGHLLYFAAVFMDGHGSYAYAAAGMLVIGIITLLAGGEDA